MDTVIIGQGYNLNINTSVGEELLRLFDSKRYDSFTCLVAFASFGGVSSLTSRIMDAKERGVEIKVILGVDQKGTSKEALEEVLSWNVESYIYHTADLNIFHPKIYLFENEDIFSLIVGSNNLTIPGLVQNVECSLMIKDIKSNPVLNAFYDYWGGILDGSEVNLYPLNQKLIDHLYVDKIIAQEWEIAKVTKSLNGDVSGGKKSLEFKKRGLQSFPEGFRPKRKQRKVKTQVVGKKGRKYIKSHEIDSQVLIAEIGSGPRWKQVNFPIAIFEEFFGAKKGDNNYSIELINISRNGILGMSETRQAVTVASKNYRFEINCKETSMPYPGGKDRPIGLFVKLGASKFLYQVLLPDYEVYGKVKEYLYMEAKLRRSGQLRRVLVDVEVVHALYPELII